MPDPTRRVEFRDASIAEAEKRRPLYERTIKALLPELVAGTITKRTLEAVRRGEIGAAMDSLKRPSKKMIRRLMREVRVRAWVAGLQEAEDTLKKLPGDVEFQDPFDVAIDEASADVDRRLREVLARLRGNPERQSRPAADVTTAQAEAVLRSALKRAREEVAEEIRQAQAKRDEAAREKALRESERVMRELKRTNGKPKSKQGKRFNTRLNQDVSRVTTPLMEVDWEVSQRAKVKRYKLDKRDIFFEFVARMDERTTPACAFLDGSIIRKDDPEVVDYTPQLHFNCRSVWRPLVRKRGADTWDTRKARLIGEPALGDTPRRYSLPNGPRQISVPSAAPNVAPPRRLSQWITGRASSRGRKRGEPVGARSTVEG